MPNNISKSLALPLLALTVTACGGEESPSEPANEAGTIYHVFYLGGQSNMDGYGFNKDLPDTLAGEQSGIMIFAGRNVEDGAAGGGMGRWSVLQPGYGTGFISDESKNQLTNRFGPELSFGAHIAALKPDENIAIIKYSRGGTGLVDGASGYGSWDPDYADGNRRNQYDNALTTIRQAFSASDIDGDGRKDKLIPAGVIWMQGEADAYDNEKAAMEYEQNLARLMELLRAALHTDDLPVIIGQIQDSGSDEDTRVMQYSPEVSAAQTRFVANDPCASLVDITENFEFIDGWHYLSENYIQLGEAFAEAVIELEGACPPSK